MARRTKAEAEATREAILDAAEHLFYQHGVSRTTLAKIASQADVTRGAIYWHFEDKADLFNAMLARVRLPFHNLLKKLDAVESGDPIAQIKELMVSGLTLIGTSEQHRRVLTIVFHRCEYIDELNPAVNTQAELDYEALEIMEKTFRRAKSNNLLRDDLDPKVAAYSLHVFIKGLISSYLIQPNECDLQSIASTMVDTMLRGMLKAR